MNTQKNILYVGNKWCDAEPEYGMSPADVPDTFEATDLGKCTWFAFDEFSKKNDKQPGDEALIKLCENNKYDFIVLDWMAIPIEFNPVPRTLDILTHKLNIPMIGIWWDTVYSAAIRRAETLLDFCKFHLVTEGCFLFYVVKDPTRYLGLWPPRNSDLFYDAGEEQRDIPISFIGGLQRPGLDRGQKIERLRKKGNIDVFHLGGQRTETKVPFEEYASLIRRSKISLNFPAGEGISQLNARTMETMLSGSMLLEDLNLETLRLFTPGIDYIAFSGHNDLVSKCQDYMNNDEERIKIAQSGCNRVTKYHNARVFWEKVINRLETG